ncbi:MAG: hypothetical protein JRG82_08330 [Deltaproteobacteria bacterium]|nr:hypothetical protein [Deltaproteobacteria bacterium]
MAKPIATRVEPTAMPSARTPAQILREFLALLEGGAHLRPAGSARNRPRSLLSGGYSPRYRVDLFGTRFYLTNVRQNADIRFYVAYVVQGDAREIFPRIFYKDVSLVWRSASHFIRSEQENWIGKGDVKTVVVDGEAFTESAEETTDLPLEIQTALETLLRRVRSIRQDHRAVELVLRRAPDSRIEPYRDFVDPRRRAAADPRNRINRGRPIARFRRRGDPTSLVFTPGFEPDFASGVLERTVSKSRLYGGRLRRFRIVSRNRRVQFLFFASPRQVWIGHPQATSTELSSYGVRTIDVIGDEDAFMPGYEYHFWDDSQEPPVLVSQIPPGFVGPINPNDPSRASASPWLEQMPVVREFRRKVLGQFRRKAGQTRRRPGR